RGRANKERKGAVEIINVLEPHLSTARVTEVVDPLRNPFLKGDLLFNPAWNPSQRVHIALAGIIDLDGDGNDDTAELIRNLEKQGIVVDAYLDLRERAIKGPGITEGTTYLVMGERPQLSQAIAADVNNPITAAFAEISGKIGKMEAKAKEKGVQNVNYRRYLTLIGYRLPKNAKPLDLTSTTYLRGVPKSEKKEEDKPK